MSTVRDLQTLLSAVVLAIALVVAAALGAHALERVRASRQTITVTGSAKEPITSDFIIWRGFVAHQADDLRTAYADLQRSMDALRAYVASRDVPAAEVTQTPITTITLYGFNEQGMQTNEVTGYRLQQGIEIRSADVDRVARIARESTQLIDQGIALESMPPEYLYTKLGELKVRMQAEAAKDAKTRAEQIAAATGSTIGQVRAARMGVLQITPRHSVEVSDYGMNDTSSREKDITAVVTVEFEVE